MKMNTIASTCPSYSTHPGFIQRFEKKHWLLEKRKEKKKGKKDKCSRRGLNPRPSRSSHDRDFGITNVRRTAISTKR